MNCESIDWILLLVNHFMITSIERWEIGGMQFRINKWMNE